MEIRNDHTVRPIQGKRRLPRDSLEQGNSSLDGTRAIASDSESSDQPPIKRVKVSSPTHESDKDVDVEMEDGARLEGYHVKAGGASGQDEGHDNARQPGTGIGNPSASPKDGQHLERTKSRAAHVSFEASAHSTASMIYGIDFTDVVTVRVRMPKADGAFTSFIVHRNLLAASSPVFDRDLASSPDVMVYTDIGGPKAFNVYLHWLYTESIQPSISETASEDASIALLVPCLVLGQAIQSIRFQDLVMDHIIFVLDNFAESGDYVLNTLVMQSYDQGTIFAPLRRFCVDYLVWRRPAFKTGWVDVPDFRADYGEALARSRDRKGRRGKALEPWMENPCRYHFHPADNEECYKSRAGEEARTESKPEATL